MRKMLIIECLNTCSHAYANIHAYNGICRHSSDPREFLTCLWKYMKMMLVLHR